MPKTVYLSGAGSISSVGSLQGRSTEPVLWVALGEKNQPAIQELNVARFITQKRDLNAMGSGQKMLVCAAGLALADAGVLEADLTDYDIYMASKIGERNDDVDAAIIATKDDADFDMNLYLARLRPTHFLAELPNLYSANIAMMFGAKGESLTFVGEASASAQAVIHALEKIESGQVQNSIVGGVFNGDQALHAEYHRSMAVPVIFGSAASCLILSASAHNALGTVARVDGFDWADLSGIVERLEITSLCVSAFPGTAGTAVAAKLAKLKGRLPVFEMDRYVGNVFEATVPLQLAFTLLNSKQVAAPRALVIVEAGRSYYEAFVLTVF